MKTKDVERPESAMTDVHHAPTEDDLRHTLAGSYPAYNGFVERLAEVFPGIAAEWRYSQQGGWYAIFVKKKRRLVYFIPRQRNFRLTVVLGERAWTDFIQGPFAPDAQPVLRAAKSFPEGMAVSMDRKRFDNDLAMALVRAKVS